SELSLLLPILSGEIIRAVRSSRYETDSMTGSFLSYIFEDTVPSPGHIVGVVRALMCQSQEPDCFVVGEVVQIKVSYYSFARVFGAHHPLALDS
ncbi:hypothetical protein, partial [Halorubrum amylolyticum]|uniref:hypothetical protein n=1 Tax=Halorubrum amylolyticum TaxID=2508724 RepID=UPI0019D6D59B